jgi:hypothetical protein
MALWDPNQLLSIKGSARVGELQCSATNTSLNNNRCGFHKWTANPHNQAVQALLPSLAATPPENITAAQLLHLAELCICEKPSHAIQKYAVAARWQAAIRDHVAAAAQEPEPRTQTPEAQIAAQAAFYPTPGSSESPRSSPNSSFSAPPTQDDTAKEKPDGKLQARVAAAEEELKRTQERLRAALAEKTTLEGDLKQLSLDWKAVQDEKPELQVALQMRDKEDAERRERDLSAAGEEKKRLADALKGMEGSLGKMQAEMEQLRTRVVALETDKKDFGQQLLEMRAELATEKTKVAALEGDKEDFGQQLEEMRVELATEKTRMSKLFRRLAVEEKKDAGRELAPVTRSVGKSGWKGRVKSWMKSMRGTHGVERPLKGVEVRYQ